MIVASDRHTGFERFFLAQQPRLVAIALGWTGDRETAREAAQETLVRAHRDWQRVGNLDRPDAWVRRVLVNLLIDRRRTLRRDVALLQRLGPPPVVDAVTFDDRRWWNAVRSLPDRQRAVVTLYYLEDLPVAEVAEILDMAPGTVKSTLSQARAALRRVLGKDVE